MPTKASHWCRRSAACRRPRPSKRFRAVTRQVLSSPRRNICGCDLWQPPSLALMIVLKAQLVRVAGETSVFHATAFGAEDDLRSPWTRGQCP